MSQHSQGQSGKQSSQDQSRSSSEQIARNFLQNWGQKGQQSTKIVGQPSGLGGDPSQQKPVNAKQMYTSNNKVFALDEAGNGYLMNIQGNQVSDVEIFSSSQRSA